MTPERAREVLAAWREDAASVESTELESALRLAEVDPALGAWLAEQQEIDTRLSDELAAVEPPSTLEAELFAKLAAEGRAPAEPADDPVEFPAPPRSHWARWRSGPLLSLAASLIVLVGIGLFVLDPNPLEAEPQLHDFLQEVQARAEQAPAADAGEAVDSWPQAQQVLAARNLPAPEGLPPEVRQATPLEVDSFRWQDQPVAVTVVDHPQRGRAQLFSISDQPFADLSALAADPSRRHEGDSLLLTWIAGGSVHAVVFPPQD